MPLTIAETVYEALYFIFPAYCANAAPVIFGGGTPIDRGRKLRDGHPLFGTSKTFRGFFAGLIIGTFVGFVEGNILSGFMLSFGMEHAVENMWLVLCWNA